MKALFLAKFATALLANADAQNKFDPKALGLQKNPRGLVLPGSPADVFATSRLANSSAAVPTISPTSKVENPNGTKQGGTDPSVGDQGVNPNGTVPGKGNEEPTNQTFNVTGSPQNKTDKNSGEWTLEKEEKIGAISAGVLGLGALGGLVAWFQGRKNAQDHQQVSSPEHQGGVIELMEGDGNPLTDPLVHNGGGPGNGNEDETKSSIV
ncbi:MAG: hypothetical protein AAGI66_02455 [Cyanobacteria bacterium P01_H01_bin.74]